MKGSVFLLAGILAVVACGALNAFAVYVDIVLMNSLVLMTFYFPEVLIRLAQNSIDCCTLLQS